MLGIIVLLIVGGFAFFMGSVEFLAAETVFQQIIAMLGLLIFAICLVGVFIVEALISSHEKTAKTIREEATRRTALLGSVSQKIDDLNDSVMMLKSAQK